MSDVHDETWKRVDDYLTGKLGGGDEVLAACLRANAEGGLPSIDVSPMQGRMLSLMAQMCGARRILEIGTLGGFSTICLARALPDGGRLISLELSPDHARVARSNIKRAGLDDKVEVIVGRAIESLEQFAADGVEAFDFIFIDADKSGYPEYLKASLKLAQLGTVIVGDNVVRGGLVANAASEDGNVQGAQAFIDLAGAEKRLLTTVIQTVGQKGYDGFLLARVIA